MGPTASGSDPAKAASSGDTVEADGLRVDRIDRGSVVIYRVTGEIDMVTAPHLDRAVDGFYANADSVSHLVLDLTDVPFLSSAGLSLLADHHRRCGALNIRLSVVATHRTPLRAIEITQLDRLISIYPSVAEALPA
jgi:anti-sigma B factor antagonist